MNKAEDVEIWKSISDADWVLVSSLGRVKHLKKCVIRSDGKPMVYPEGEYKLLRSPQGYDYIWVSYIKKRLAVHRLVADCFCEKPNTHERLCVNHKNGIKTDNRAINLEWATYSQNQLHSYKILGRKKHLYGKTGDNHHCSKPVIGKSTVDGSEIRFGSANISKAFGFSPSCISNCARGGQSQHNGFVWRFESGDE